MLKIESENLIVKASRMQDIRASLFEELNEGSKLMERLQEYWEGPAYDELKEAFDHFKKKYYESYEELLNTYIQSLKVHIAEGYDALEKENIQRISNVI